jgi:hypothetical protein
LLWPTELDFTRYGPSNFSKEEDAGEHGYQQGSNPAGRPEPNQNKPLK